MTTDHDEALRLARRILDRDTFSLTTDAVNEVAAALVALHAESERLRAELARWESLGERHDIQPRPPGCRCDQEPGDSACPVHGDECEAT